MANYLLECEIVGGEISSISQNAKITVRPKVIYPKSEVPERNCDMAVLLDASNLKSASLMELSDAEERTIDLRFGIGSNPSALFGRNYSEVVLEIGVFQQTRGAISPKNAQIVDFKARF